MKFFIDSCWIKSFLIISMVILTNIVFLATLWWSILIIVKAVSETASNEIIWGPEEGEYVEGDMDLSSEQMEDFLQQTAKKNAFASLKVDLWITNNKTDTIKYYIDPKIDRGKGYIKLAIEEYEKYTCLKFQELASRPSAEHHIYFTKGKGCASPVGRQKNENKVRLGKECWKKGNVMHEIGHSIGLIHEQSRPDRDQYISIVWDNVKKEMFNNFDKEARIRKNSVETKYDYDSMMHYGSKYFTENGGETIRTTNPNNQKRIGQRDGFSDTDKTEINKMYGCSEIEG